MSEKFWSLHRTITTAIISPLMVLQSAVRALLGSQTCDHMLVILEGRQLELEWQKSCHLHDPDCLHPSFWHSCWILNCSLWCSPSGAGNNRRWSHTSRPQWAHILLLQQSVFRGDDWLRQSWLCDWVVPLWVRGDHSWDSAQREVVLQSLLCPQEGRQNRLGQILKCLWAGLGKW